MFCSCVLGPHVYLESDRRGRFLTITFLDKGVGLVDLPSMSEDGAVETACLVALGMLSVLWMHRFDKEHNFNDNGIASGLNAVRGAPGA